MTTITNKTTKPITIPLPRGGKLHLGPRKSGQVSEEAANRPVFQKLVEAGTIEIVGSGHEVAGSAAGGARHFTGAGGQAGGGVHRRSGDR